MCGIAGFTQFNGPVGDKALLKLMGEKIIHRGPDACGEFLDDKVGLSHRRLSIIDLSEAGNQPMYSDDGNLVIAFNGEIYNFLELRCELQEQGYNFKSQTDTEVILALYQRMGRECLQKLNGMFAIALWDKTKQELFLARDRVGKKPLYYYDDGALFAFGSEIKAILPVPGVKRKVRAEAVYDFFTYQYIPDPKTIFCDLYKLKPGHWLTISKKGLATGCYWDVSFAKQSSKSEKEIEEELLANLKQSVKRRMISDVPLGAFLSGGIDSSAVVALMAEEANEPVTTCAIGFDSKEFDEIDYAKKVAELYQTDHHEFTVRQNVEENLEKIVSYFDEPFADPSLVPTYFVSKLAREKVTVALAGDGGDENFAGYSKYSVDATENRLRSMVPSVIRENLFPVLSRLLSRSSFRFLQRSTTLLDALSHSPSYGYFLTNSFFKEAMWDDLVKTEFKKELNGYHPYSVTEEYYNKANGKDHLSKILYTDIKTYMTGGVLVKVDRMSMANSLEVRAPLLDGDFMEFAATVPSEMKLKEGEKKYILKESMRNHLPNEILYRKKMGFSVPLASWLRGELKQFTESRLFRKYSGVSQFFDMDVLQVAWTRHQEGSSDHAAELWSMLMFELWWVHYIEASTDDIYSKVAP